MGHVIKAALKLLPRLVVSYFAWILSYSGKHKDKIALETRYAKSRTLILHANKALDNDVHIFGKENIPDEVCCFYGNHLGACDPLPIFEAMEKPVAFVAKKEVKKMPFVGRIFEACGGLFLDRSDLKQQIEIMMKVEKSLTDREMNWFIFPEGTRNKDQMARIQNFHNGSFRGAIRSRVPIVPVAIFSTFRLLKNKIKAKKYPTFVSFLKPILPEEYEGKTPEEVAKMVYSRIQKEITFRLRLLDHEYMSKIKGYRFNEI